MLLTVNEKLTIFKKFNLNKDASIGIPFNIDLLVKLGISLDIQSGPEKESPLHVCCKFNNFYFFEKLLEQDLDLELLNKNGKTALMVAAEVGATKIVEKLLGKFVKLEVKDKINKNTAIMLACKNGNLECTRLLCQSGAKLDNIGENGYNCFLLAVESGNHKLVNYLVTKMDPNFKTNVTNDTALHVATRKENVKMVKMLLKYNADKTIKNKFTDQTALDIATENDNTVLVTLLSANNSVSKKRKRDISLSSSSNKRKK